MKHLRPLTLLAATLSLSLAILGCNALGDTFAGDSAQDAEAAIGSLTLTDQEAALLAIAALSVDLEMTPEQMAAAAEADAPNNFEPSSCVDTAVAGSVVTYTFNECDGAFGMRNLSGVAAIAFSLAGSSDVAVNLTATDLDADSVTLTINTTSTVTPKDDGSLQIALTTSGAGITQDQTVLARAGSYIAIVNDTCITLDGNWNTTIEEAVWSTLVSDYTRCDGQCPGTGGTLVYTALDDTGDGAPGEGPETTAITLRFDGTDTASFVSSDGGIGTTPLTCGE